MVKWNYIVPYIKSYKFNSLFVRNLILIVLLVTVPLTSICLAFYVSSNNSIWQEIYGVNVNFANTVKNVMDTSIKEFDYLAINTSFQDEILHYTLLPPANYSDDTTFLNVCKYIKNFTYTNRAIHSIYIYCNKNNSVLSGSRSFNLDEFNDKNWFESYKGLKNNNSEIFLRARNNNFPYFLTIIKPINAVPNENTGCVVLNIDILKLMNNFSKLSTSSVHDIYIIKNDGSIIFSPQKENITKHSSVEPFCVKLSEVPENSSMSVNMNDTDFVVSGINSDLFDWKYYSVMPLNLYRNKFTELMAFVIKLMLTTMIISIIISAYISLKTFVPIKSIIELIDNPEIQAEQLYTDAPKNETNYITNRIISTLVLNKKLESELDARLMLLKYAQIVALQSQINPHFLYNTLDTINWMAINLTKGKNDVSTTIHVLSSLFKSNIDTSNYITRLTDELEYTIKYLKILNIRFKDKFETIWNIDDTLGEQKVPRLILQPIAENAIQHGIKPKEGKGHLIISASVIKNDLIITVQDDGAGIDKESLDKLNVELAEKYIYSSKNIGIKNVNERIKLIYGDKYGLKIESTLSVGTKIIMTFPVRT